MNSIEWYIILLTVIMLLWERREIRAKRDYAIFNVLSIPFMDGLTNEIRKLC